MKGLTLSEKYFEAYGREMIESKFPEYKDRIAVGLSGEGSECFGYDDDISHDHDFGPKFCMWLTADDYMEIGSDLQKAYDALPSEFMGFSRNNSFHDAGRHGVIPIEKFFTNYTGCPQGPVSLQEWFRVPSHFLAVCTNGKIFEDRTGTFTAIRERVRSGMPEDIRKKKIAASVFEMAQSGQYNLPRCLARGENAAAYLASNRFVSAALKTIFYLNKAHCPYYKWTFRALKDLDILSSLYYPLMKMLSLYRDNPDKLANETERISILIGDEIRSQGLSNVKEDYLEPVAWSVQESIEDPTIRSIHITREN